MIKKSVGYIFRKRLSLSTFLVDIVQSSLFDTVYTESNASATSGSIPDWLLLELLTPVSRSESFPQSLQIRGQSRAFTLGKQKNHQEINLVNIADGGPE